MKDFGQVAERLRRSTVQVLGSGADQGSGSGIIWEGGGLIVTNAHVARGHLSQIELWDGTRLPGKLIKRDARSDLALLRVDATGLPAVSLADSSALRAGDLVIAVGNPLGFVGAVSTGVVHTVGTLAGFGSAQWVQSTVRLAPGNSGGPLANIRGEIIGVNTMVVRFWQGRNLALAIGSAGAGQFVKEAERSVPELGMTVHLVEVQKDKSIGLLITSTRPGFPADVASLMVGDLISGVNGRKLKNSTDVAEAADAISGVISLQFRRGGDLKERTATLLIRNRRTIAA